MRKASRPASITPPSSRSCGSRGFAIDREGRFIHEGAEVVHEGLRRALFRWLDRLPRRAATSCGSTSGASPTSTSTTRRWWRGRRGSIRRRAICLSLSDGAEEPLEPDDADRRRGWRPAGLGARRAARGAAGQLGRRRARRAAQESPTARPALRVAGRTVPLPARRGRVTRKRAPPSGDGARRRPARRRRDRGRSCGRWPAPARCRAPWS